MSPKVSPVISSPHSETFTFLIIPVILTAYGWECDRLSKGLFYTDNKQMGSRSNLTMTAISCPCEGHFMMISIVW